MMDLKAALGEVPIIAIIRGVTPDEVETVAEALISAGVRVIEVPMNSPDPLTSIRRLARFSDRVVHGAGTVLSAEMVDQVVEAGGRIIVAPNTDAGVIRRSLQRGLAPMPGFGTATEAFEAYAAGARYLKLYPASSYGVAHVKAMLDVLPKDVVVQPVGGVKPEQMADWWAAGARGFGMGGDLFKPGFTPDEVHVRAVAAVAAVRALRPDVAETNP
ncbi:2-dehydro-3-deoxy-6-phosphogalactonate aldolase [Caulobacter sp. S45]|uniref:2-dehydro-3-deoxy-6-phosphogalactonate aldolase n=1 Tax=Caulobacter sp. S45 TaxID=1641861 RepID=UPI0015765B1B|nr:2-dehydro-3-deoxy-6-phosphogalactonate aldolase [Caulobacter sp. S45]